MTSTTDDLPLSTFPSLANHKTFNSLIIKITISSIVIGLKSSYFPLVCLPSCCEEIKTIIIIIIIIIIEQLTN